MCIRASIFSNPASLRNSILKSHIPPSSLFSARSFHTTPGMCTRDPVFASTYDPARGSQELALLLRGEGSAGRWVLAEGGKGVERGFKFKSFKKTWEFMNVIAAECAKQKHHPEWSNVYNTTFIRWTTHSPPGLSEKDTLMARFCDEQALVFGEVVVEGEAGGKGKELADRVASEGGDCCVPKKKVEGAGEK